MVTLTSTLAKNRFWRLAKSALLLRCPRCFGGPVFRGLFRIEERCSRCGFKFEREQGYFVGAIYINYAATVAIAMPGYFVLDYLAEPSLATQLIFWGGFAVVFPPVFFRHSRCLWLAIVDFVSPPELESSGGVRRG